MQEMAGKCSAYTVPEQRSVWESFILLTKQNFHQAAENRVIDGIERLQLGLCDDHL